MTDTTKLPPLPEPSPISDSGFAFRHTDDAMLAYGAECRRMALEEADDLRRQLQEAHEARRAAQAECERLKEERARIGVEHRRLIAEAVEKEREACAKVCDIKPGTEPWEVHGGEQGVELCGSLAEAIRARAK